MNKKIKKAAIGVNKFVLELLGVPMLVAAFLFLVGCSKHNLSLDNGYELKQVQYGNLETNYVICKKCIEYTKITK